MKKSMVVTTIVMVLLLVVALSTATFAWYTAQSNATVTETLVTSANSTSASLVIDTAKATSSTANQSSVDITMNQAINPAMYNSATAPVVGTTTYADFKAAFITYTVDNAGNYASAPTTTQVAAITDVKGSGSSAVEQDSFYVTNVGGVASGISAAVTINPNYYAEKAVNAGESVEGLYTKNGDAYEATQTGATAEAGTTYYELKANPFLRVAMFIDGKYVGTWASSEQAAVQYANITIGAGGPAAGDTPAAHSNYTATASGTAENVVSSVAPMGGVQVQLVAWFEGDSHTNAYAGTGALFTVMFSGVAAANND